MDLLIPVINELQNVFKKTGTETIQLPQIVVVGSQSCGKSSVLESLVGKSFLPRGSGIVTRSPIILQLIHLEKSKASEDDGPIEWCSFSSEPQKKYSDFDEVRKEIEYQTDKLAGCNKGISMEPIIVRVCSPNIISLTVVDLPGVVKVPVGDQPYDIEEQVRKLILKYITNPNAIILAVSPANADIATSESIKIAKEVDPNGDRTLAVITKLDLMDKGTDASKVLAGEVIYVKLGIIGVVNRSQYDIDNDKSMEDALHDEDAFFRKSYPTSIGQIGSKFLGKRLNQLLMKHIQGALPQLIKRITDLTETYEARQYELGPEIAAGAKEKLWVMMDIVNGFVKNYQEAVSERPPVAEEEKEDELYVVRIAEIFQQFSENLKKNHPSKDHLELKISRAIQKSVNMERFTSIEDVFKSLAKQQINRMEIPSIKCAEEFHGVLFRAVEHCLTDKRLETLNAEICRVTRRLLNSQLKEAKNSIKEYMKIQTGMIFSSDEEFMKLLKFTVREADNSDSDNDNSTEVVDAVRQLGISGMKHQDKKSMRMSFPLTTSIEDESGQHQREYVKSLITQYYNVIEKQIADYMPKHLKYHLYNCTMEKLPKAIREATMGKESELISEPEHVIKKREETEEMLQNLYQATEIIGGIQSRI